MSFIQEIANPLKTHEAIAPVDVYNGAGNEFVFEQKDGGSSDFIRCSGPRNNMARLRVVHRLQR